MGDGPGGVNFGAVFRALPTPYLVMTPELVIADANDAYVALVGRERGSMVGRPVFEVFPPSPGELDADGRNAVQVSFERARDTGTIDPMPLQRYSIVDPATGKLAERFWSLISAPVTDAEGRTCYVLQRTEDVTDYVRERQQSGSDPDSVLLLRRVDEVEADLSARARELQAAVAARDLSARRLAAVSEVALALTSVSTVEELERTVVGRGLSVLGADGGAVISPAPGSGWRITINEALGEQVQQTYGLLDYDSPLPACWTARTGQRLLLPTRESGLAFTPEMQAVYDDTGRHGWAFLPLLVGEACLGCLAVAWIEEHAFTTEQLGLLDGFAAQCAQALDRIRTAEEQRRAVQLRQRFSETLQRSMLTPPPSPGHLSIEVRYHPAAEEAQIGGDWYDAFTQPAGATVLVIGDVVGHDGAAAAAMGQLRGLLRALAYDNAGSLAEVLSRTESVASGLQVSVLATAVLAQIERTPDVTGGRRMLRWSNAGHLPPVLLSPDGEVEALEEPADLLLGVDPLTGRVEHTRELPADSTLLLFTDGLVERRGESLNDGYARLSAALADLGRLPLRELCDVLLDRMVEGGAEDDIALLGLRVNPE